MPGFSGLSALYQAATEQLGGLPSPSGGRGKVLSNIDENPEPYLDVESTQALIPDDDRPPLSFTEKLMTLLLDSTNNDIITFLPDGTYFAMRTKEFSEGPLHSAFLLDSFQEFLEQMKGWGFTRVCGNEDESRTGIQVFRHPMFRRDNQEGLESMKFGQNPTEARMSAIPDRLNTIHLVRSEDSGSASASASSSSKRRLSPSHTERDIEDSYQKTQRVFEGDKVESVNELSIVRSSSSGYDSEHSVARRRSSTEIRSYALAMATAELDMQSTGGDDNSDHARSFSTGAKEGKTNASLIEGGVERATQTIVTDAIETLLFDEGHTRQTFKKHEKELSRSSFPGVVPISKQLFSRAAEGTGTGATPGHADVDQEDDASCESKGHAE
ncbi:unnamed protein product [Cylindrotheca closterium]|uniref:HSF-type DNA-binding domain-containing protein n=1 Tax=Cylindrotheca closterium TaxID=2856 RepID=A0AAD2CSM9_9STRA|nr:unnamed protein product [Cylindrotheca closterium]